MTISKKAKDAGILLGIIGVILILIVSVIVFGVFDKKLPPDDTKTKYPSDHLFVDATYLLKTDETNESVFVNCDLYLTNTWEKESGEIKAIAYVIETENNFAVNKSTVEIGEIKANATSEIGIPLTLSNSSYKIEILLFEKELLKIKGKLTIQANPVYSFADIDHDDNPATPSIKKGIVTRWDVNQESCSFNNIRE